MIKITPMILEFCPNLSQRSTRIEIFQQREECHLKKMNESSKQCEDNQHASNLSLIILDEHKNLHNNIFDKHGSAVSPEGWYTVEHHAIV
jgi:hypothetical protein